MLLCVAGKNRIAVDLLDAASRLTGSEICVVPNASDKGEDGWQPSLKKEALRRAVPVVSLEWVMAQKELCFLSVEYDRIVRPDRFRTARLFNIHFSLLPKYRGCNTSIWPILNGEREHGVTLHRIDAGVDTGPIIAQRSFSIEGLTARDVYFRCMAVGAELLIEWLPRLLTGEAPSRTQPEDGASHYRRGALDFSLKELDLTEPVEQVMRRVRAFTFPEYQLPTLEGRAIVAADPVSTPEAKRPRTVDTVGPHHVIAWAADGALDIRLAD